MSCWRLVIFLFLWQSATAWAADPLSEGNELARQGRVEEALAAYGRAAGQPELALRGRLNAARLLEQSGDRAQVVVAAEALTAPVSALPPGAERNELTLALGRLWHRLWLGEPRRVEWRQRAERDYQAVAEAAGDQPVWRAQALGLLGELQQTAGQPWVALALAQRAEFLAQAHDLPEQLPRWQLLTARLLLHLGEPSQALEAYRRAVHSLNLVKTELMQTDGRAFQETLGPAYLELADHLLAEARSRPEDEAQGLLREARTALEQRKVAELEDYFRDDCVSAARTGRHGLGQPPPGVAILHPVLLPDRLVLLVEDDQGHLRQTVVPVGVTEVEKEARRLRQLLEKRSTRQYLRPAQILYDWLARPLEPLLAGVGTLLVVPDAVLRTIPLAALHDGHHFLIERVAVAVTPSLDLTGDRPLQARHSSVLMGGITGAVQGFPALPFVADELRSVGELTARNWRLQDEEFSRANLHRLMEERVFPIVHLATHAQFAGEARHSFILTHHERLTLDQLDLLVRRADQQGGAVEMLTLSACETAHGDDRAALGLAGVAIKAGAQSALATLWTVNDEASAKLVSRFYHHLVQEGLDKAEALRRAQRELMTDRRYRHPGYWAPFLLIGNWR